MTIAMLDNFDSFTYNLVHYLKAAGAEVLVMRNDSVDFESIRKCNGLVLSPGPGLPNESGQLMEVVSKTASSTNILGVCLGLQAIVQHFGGELEHANQLYHGEESELVHFNNHLLFNKIPEHFKAGRYHSWIANKSTLPQELVITAEDASGSIMALKHQTLPIHAVQFHPESIMTPDGLIMIENWISSL